MKRIVLLLVTTALLTSSCSKLLDKDPDFVSPENYYNTESDLNRALNGVYNRLIDTYGRMYSRGLFSYFVVSDEAFFKNISINNIRVMVFDAGDLDIGRLWEVSYEGINRANLLIENADKADMDTVQRKAIKGEALFMRAYYHYILADNFGAIPLKLTSTKSPSDANLPRTPLPEVYARIVADMKEAENMVNAIDHFSFNERVSKTAVQAMLARVFLKMAGQPLNDVAKYNDALEYANKVIASGKHSLNPDYKQIFINHSQNINESKECIWEVGMYGNKIGNIDQAGWVGVENGIECPSEAIGYSGGAMRTTAKLFNLFGTKDTLRRNWCIAPYKYVASGSTAVKSYFTDAQIYDRNPGKWRREYENEAKARSYNSTNFPLIRYSDVLLMKAEAENEVKGMPTAEAYNAINMVRRRAFGKDVNTPNVDADIPAGLDKIDFLEELKKERARELCFEGIRKHDLIRWGMYVQTMNALGADINVNAPAGYKYAGNAGANTTARNVLFPIPNTELNINKQISQNPGY
ncbi:RagB/SusD family nutrient uptake outer membrane protein [Filimonas effusa]|uniref:RagB/SusD family nutrient uptake outer membrane protein n=1 Tax=Filimonas effusa TaxID=2508721 RepID=A0A4Q1DDB9_9BACT|nr:RagB/SusD family nutrient uptake outer membrane protein [Filimonas effusa]RXK86968.1 RagB/SusD family nutrient uptake outer membrane protein [Filimonas effusa]